jgi:hypothetical protein
VAFVFKLGFTKPDPLQGNQNMSLFSNSTTPGWTGYLSSSLIHLLLRDERKFQQSKQLLNENLEGISNFLHPSERNLKKYPESYNRNFPYVAESHGND